MPRRRGFTLVELLVVIGIIALLIGILLPALNAARRQSQQTKCLASLREIGNGFAAYAAANKGFWPCAVHDFGCFKNGKPWYPLPFNRRLRWQDRLLPYISNVNNVDSYTDIAVKIPNEVLRKTSVLWGCPAYRLSAEDEHVTTTTDDAVRNGYSMSVYPLLPAFATGNPDWSYIEGAGNTPFQFSNPAQHLGISGRYFKAHEWKRASERLLLDEGLAYYISMAPELRPPRAPPFDPGQYHWWPFENTTRLDATTNEWENNCHFWIDGSRHAPPGVTKQQTWNKPYTNALFCDGHAQPVSVREAWQAIVNPGGNDAPAWP
jgi:prepilin-type N-terminal cleavage/methylation domain-containing protein/prepilin-type processing-associated H-X9-DG protein